MTCRAYRHLLLPSDTFYYLPIPSDTSVHLLTLMRIPSPSDFDATTAYSVFPLEISSARRRTSAFAQKKIEPSI